MSVEHITVKKISDKESNMKRQWKEAKGLQEKSGWGISDYDERSVNDALKKKCMIFGRCIRNITRNLSSENS